MVEADISFLPDGKVKKVYSRSCTADAPLSVAVPATLSAQPKGCMSTMVRYESTSGGLTVEEWRQEGGTLVIEVSIKGKDGKPARKAFKSEVVDVLVAAGVKPLDRSKTEIGMLPPTEN